GNTGRPEFARTERPAGDRPRSFGDRPNAGGDRSRSERPSSANAGAPNRSFGDSVAFGKKPYARDGQAGAARGDSRSDNRGNRPDANRNDNRVLSARYEGRSETRTDAPRADRSSAPTRRDGVKVEAGRSQGRSEGRSAPRSNADSRGFAGAGSSTPRRPRSFV
ncbi:MAG: hypothetical protein H0W85_07165, partial [Methylotenera sp.]|nr:hypothetical protein [Methylotenera sp.]